MGVRVLFFGVLKEIVAKAGESLDLDDGSSVADVLAHYESQIPPLKNLRGSIAIALNQEYARPDSKLKPNDEIALLPPVSGGVSDAVGKTPVGQLSESGHRVRIVREAIDTASVLAKLKRAEDGAAVVFEGVVRNQTRSRRTLFLDYEAYEE